MRAARRQIANERAAEVRGFLNDEQKKIHDKLIEEHRQHEVGGCPPRMNNGGNETPAVWSGSARIADSAGK